MIFSHNKILSIILYPLPQFPFNRIAKAKGVAFSKSCRFYLLNMEESLPVQSKETMSPLNTVQDPIPPHNNTKKRKQCDVDIRNSAYFKILHLVQQLRPHFIEVTIPFNSLLNMCLFIADFVSFFNSFMGFSLIGRLSMLGFSVIRSMQ